MSNNLSTKGDVMNVLIAGASGLIGTALSNYLQRQGHSVYPLLRAKSKAKKSGQTGQAQCYWQPEQGIIELDSDITFDVVVVLNGVGIADKRWTAARKQQIIDSRVIPSKLMAETLAKLARPPKLFIGGSAIGYYGDTGNDWADETSPAKDEFMSDICQQWEAASQVLDNTDIRRVNIRTGVVLSAKGGALPQMMLPIKLGVGGKVGTGQQYISWISVIDVCRAISFIIDNDTISGPVNLTAPKPVTNLSFTKTLGKLLHRPTLLPLPAVIARLVFGELANDLLLASNRIKPSTLTAAGFNFDHPDLTSALSEILLHKH